MDASTKKTLKAISQIEKFKKAIAQITTGKELDDEDRTYILTASILFIEEFQRNKKQTSFAELAYYIILKDAIKSKDYRALHDFSINFGFYPITKKLFTDGLVEKNRITDELLDLQLEHFEKENYVETLHQNNTRLNLMEGRSQESAYIAPTSFGKSSVIIDFIRANLRKAAKIAVIVPTKSLLMQTYRMIKGAGFRRRILIHDEMYNKEANFIAILTQERCLRLMAKADINFDILFIDEAHNLLENDSRAVLLSRLIRKNRQKNSNGKIVYLSPLVDDASNLRVDNEQTINSYTIPFNIKEPDIFELRSNKYRFQYNRFVNEFYKLEKYSGTFSYIIKNSLKKNFLYTYRPIIVEDLAKQLAANLSPIDPSKELLELIRTLKREVHEDFYLVEYLSKGVVYIHGKMPDLIKEFIEYCFSSITQLKYIVANKVILEGINLPIDNLYVLNTYNLHGRELTNLIGRVNRLNTIFQEGTGPAAFKKLLPPVHFVNSIEYGGKNSKMENKIQMLRSRVFEDPVQNCTLANYDITDIPKKQREKRTANDKKVLDREALLAIKPQKEVDRIRQYLIETGIASIYTDLERAVKSIDFRINSLKHEGTDSADFMNLIFLIFINGLTDIISEYDIIRLEKKPARDFYNGYITTIQRRALKQNVIYMVDYYKKERARKDDRRYKYFGESYGELPSPYRPSRTKTYVDLIGKSDEALVNLAIVKLKMEDDYVSFKLNRFIIMLHDFGLIATKDFHLLVYGTVNKQKIEMVKLGLSISLISRLENDGLLELLKVDSYGNLIATPEFNEKKNNLSNLYQFEINRHIN